MNLPNRLTVSRFIIAVIMIIVYSLYLIPNESIYPPILQLGTYSLTWIDIVCCVLFIIGSFTDFLDGHIARSRKLITDFGKFMDPLADKFLVDSALILLCARENTLLLPFFTVIFIGRDLAVDGLRFMASSKGRVMAANIYGKIKTVAQMIAIPVIFLKGIPFALIGLATDSYAFIPYVTNILIGIACFASLMSGIIYFVQNHDVIGKDM